MDRKFNPFPASPKDGDCFLREDGYIYKYDAAKVWWEKLKRPVDYLEDYYLPYQPGSMGQMIKAIVEEGLKED